jgi:hypothetical protein
MGSLANLVTKTCPGFAVVEVLAAPPEVPLPLIGLMAGESWTFVYVVVPPSAQLPRKVGGSASAVIGKRYKRFVAFPPPTSMAVE